MSEFYSDSETSLPSSPNSTRDVYVTTIDGIPVFYSYSHDEAISRVKEDVHSILKDGHTTPRYSIIRVKSIDSSVFSRK